MILVCDDDKDIRNALKIYLENDGYTVIQADNGREALQQMKANDVQLILLDIMMPEMDGIQAAVKIRETSNVPIIFLSAKSEDTDRILGLQMGGDDYVTKPFNPVELLARVAANLRRYARLGGMQTPAMTEEKNVYHTGELFLNAEQKKVMLADQEIRLTAVEYKILELLMSHMDQVFSSEQIYENVWEEQGFQVTKIISVHIRHLREKIEINPKKPQYIQVIYGLGYKAVKLL
ncbi:MAG: response regulator transcription factor [Streptococcaceae bacterium]|jgi:DNA-binding response OmpR family regulator|nr:response regulator transcription factor [Streptococcaceae bacterium]